MAAYPMAARLTQPQCLAKECWKSCKVFQLHHPESVQFMNDGTNAELDEIVDKLSKISPQLRAKVSYKFCLQQLESLRIPFINGEIFGNGHTLIKVASWKKAVEVFNTATDAGSVAVVQARFQTDEDNQEQFENLLYLSVYIRIGRTNTWIYQNIVDLETEDSTEEDDYDEELFEEETEEQKALMKSLMLALATNVGFTSLKTIGLRSEYALYHCKKSDIDLPLHLISTASHQAFALYEFGILPTKVKNLIAEGYSTKEIANRLSVTKAKVEKSLRIEVDGPFGEYLNEIGY